MQVRGIRGAITTQDDLAEEILSATKKLMLAILESNPSLNSEDVASVLITVTQDLVSTFPAIGVRDIGWQDVPIMCMQEIPVPGSLPRCIRVLAHWNTDLSQSEINHVYLRDARSLRPDLMEDAK